MKSQPALQKGVWSCCREEDVLWAQQLEARLEGYDGLLASLFRDICSRLRRGRDGLDLLVNLQANIYIQVGISTGFFWLYPSEKGQGRIWSPKKV